MGAYIMRRRMHKGSIWDMIPPDLPYFKIKKEFDEWVKDRKDAQTNKLKSMSKASGTVSSAKASRSKSD
jgi:hypothetical protein